MDVVLHDDDDGVVFLLSYAKQLIVDFIKKKNEQYLHLEEDAHRMKTVTAEGDCRVDCALYFIAAHRLKYIDIKFMKAISEHVSVLPCIAKADRWAVCVYLLPLGCCWCVDR